MSLKSDKKKRANKMHVSAPQVTHYPSSFPLVARHKIILSFGTLLPPSPLLLSILDHPLCPHASPACQHLRRMTDCRRHQVHAVVSVHALRRINQGAVTTWDSKAGCIVRPAHLLDVAGGDQAALSTAATRTQCSIR